MSLNWLQPQVQRLIQQQLKPMEKVRVQESIQIGDTLYTKGQVVEVSKVIADRHEATGYMKRVEPERVVKKKSKQYMNAYLMVGVFYLIEI